MHVGIFFFRPWLGGGTTTFTAHLFKAIEAAGHTPMIYRVKERGEGRPRPFAKYEGVKYQNITFERARDIVNEMPTVMASPAHSKYLPRPDVIPQLMRRGMRIVAHDPNEFKVYDHIKAGDVLPQPPICIRPTFRQFYKDAVFIPHPYMRSRSDDMNDERLRKYHAISVARIASVKRPHIILEANRLVPKKLRVKLLGSEYRMYTRALAEKYPDVFQQSGKTFQFPMTFEAPTDLCANADFNVDMTWFPDDGGGTQYAQMEAMDAGCINVMHVDWFRFKGELKPTVHVKTVVGPAELAKLLRNGVRTEVRDEIRAAGYRLLKRHAPKVVGEMYMKELLTS